MGSFGSTPAFELFARGLNTYTVKKFRGLNKWATAAALPGNYASDILNVIVSGSGGLEKMRVPVPLSPPLDPATYSNISLGPGSFWQFETGTGAIQTLAVFGTKIFVYDGNMQNPALVDDDPGNVGQWSFVESNNILYGVNGTRARRWDGANWFQWGITAPTDAPEIGGQNAPTFIIETMSRAADVVTASLQNGPTLFSLVNLSVGSVVYVRSTADPSFDGTVQIASVVTPGVSYTWNQVGADAGPVAGLLSPTYSSLSFTIANAIRANGLTTIFFTPAPLPANLVVPAEVTVAGAADGSMDGDFPVAGTGFGTNPAVVEYLQPGDPDSQPGGGGTVSFGITLLFGRMWAYAYGNDAGGVSNMSPPTPISGPLTGATAYLHFTPPTDPQVTKVYIFSTLDGGSDFFLNTVITDLTAISTGDFIDSTPDSGLDLQIRGPLINNPAPIGKYLCLHQGRVVMGNIVGNASLVKYSGYEQILLGRPEESWPAFNGFQLQIGARAINGVGAIQSGVVLFSDQNASWMVRGQLEDITLAAPINFSAFLEQMPWKLGCASHFTIQSTPHGLMWLAGDLTLRVFTGSSAPADISYAVYPILRSITPGTAGLASAGYFNWLERDWYALTVATNGSQSPNQIVFWDDEEDSGSNVGVFISNIAADFISSLDLGSRRGLCISHRGIISELPVSSVTTSGVASPITSTSGDLPAHWRGGYFGQDNLQRNKIWRKCLLLTDNQGFSIIPRYVDLNRRTFRSPEVGQVVNVNNHGFAGLNRKANLVSCEIIFPRQDISCSVLAMLVEYIPASDL